METHFSPLRVNPHALSLGPIDQRSLLLCGYVCAVGYKYVTTPRLQLKGPISSSTWRIRRRGAFDPAPLRQEPGGISRCDRRRPLMEGWAFLQSALTRSGAGETGPGSARSRWPLVVFTARVLTRISPTWLGDGGEHGRSVDPSTTLTNARAGSDPKTRRTWTGNTYKYVIRKWTRRGCGFNSGRSLQWWWWLFWGEPGPGVA